MFHQFIRRTLGHAPVLDAASEILLELLIDDMRDRERDRVPHALLVEVIECLDAVRCDVVLLE